MNKEKECSDVKLEERIKMIDEFFNNLTVEEFEKMAIDCGVNEIEPVSSLGMERNGGIVRYEIDENVGEKEMHFPSEVFYKLIKNIKLK